jgi:aryl-alcohol dehydrogenase-like predicted oxidoreductase
VKYRSFGRTGWQVSEIGFGAWQIGGDWGKVNDKDSVDTLLHAFAKGVNFVDTAELYGDGHSETIIGQALKQWKGEKIYVATKVRPVVWPSPDDDSPQMRGRFPEWYLRDNVEKSLKRLGVEQIDLFQLHSFMPLGLVELDWLETLLKLCREGKIDRIGISLRDNRPDEGVELARAGLVDSQQVIFNMFEQRPRLALFPEGGASRTAFIARVPLDSGSLTGSWTRQSYASWEIGGQPYKMFRGDRFTETMNRLERLQALCKPYFANLAEAAIRFVLSEPEVSTLIPGMKNRHEVDLNIAYCDDTIFPQELKDKLAEHMWVRNYYT